MGVDGLAVAVDDDDGRGGRRLRGRCIRAVVGEGDEGVVSKGGGDDGPIVVGEPDGNAVLVALRELVVVGDCEQAGDARGWLA